MLFKDKLVFLMNITQTSNKELANGISVDPSLISLLRSGKRKQPKNANHIKNMAKFFSRRCAADFQRNALAEMSGYRSICSSMPTEVLEKHLENMLMNRQYIDMCHLATADEVRSGKIRIPFPYTTYPHAPVYTPETYVMHLKNILRLTEEYDNYYFVPYNDESWENYNANTY